MVTVDQFLSIMDKASDAQTFPITEALAAAMDHLMEDPNRVSFNLPLPLRNAVIKAISVVWLEVTRDTVILMTDAFKEGFPELEKKANQQAEILRIASDYSNRYGAQQAVNVIRTTEQQIRDLINGGLSAGEARRVVYEKISARIPEIAEVRGLVVSRTEAHSASQFASQQMAERSQIPLAKIWNSIIDDRTRSIGLRQSAFDHLIMNETKIPLRRQFQVPRKAGGFENLMFPGDPNGSAGNVINCRCIQTYVRA